MPPAPAAGVLAHVRMVVLAAAALFAGGLAASTPAQVINADWLSPANGVWADAGNWSSAEFPDNSGPNEYAATINAAGSPFVVSLDTSIALKQLTLDSADATVDAGPITVEVTGAANLDAGTFVMNETVLDGGTWTLGADGMLTGNGEVNATLVLGAGGSLSPGFSAGQLTITGDYLQGDGGRLRVDILGVADGEFDTVEVTGQADLGGTLVVDATEADTLLAGDVVPLLTAGAVTPGSVFTEVVSVGLIDAYFAPTYTPGAVLMGVFDTGDMNRDGVIDQADVAPFALALIRPLDYFATFFIFGDESGDMDGNGVLDFDDIDEFMAEIEGGEVSTLLAEIDRLNGIPEPGAATLLALAGGLAAVTRRRPVA